LSANKRKQTIDEQYRPVSLQNSKFYEWNQWISYCKYVAINGSIMFSKYVLNFHSHKQISTTLNQNTNHTLMQDMQNMWKINSS